MATLEEIYGLTRFCILCVLAPSRGILDCTLKIKNAQLQIAQARDLVFYSLKIPRLRVGLTDSSVA